MAASGLSSPVSACYWACCSRAVRAPATRAAVDAPLARESLKFALDHWKKGEAPESLLSSETPMTAQDFEWASGAKLLDYQLLDEGSVEDANLRVQVKITLGEQGKSKAVEKTALTSLAPVRRSPCSAIYSGDELTRRRYPPGHAGGHSPLNAAEVRWTSAILRPIALPGDESFPSEYRP